MSMRKKLLLLVVAVVTLFIIYPKVLGPKWRDVTIKHYDGKILVGQEFDTASLTGTEWCNRRKARAYFKYFPENLNADHPVVKAYLNGNIVILHKEWSRGQSTQQWQLSGSLDGPMKDIVPGGGKLIEATSYSVKGWTVEWGRHPTDPVKVIVITNPAGKSRTFRIEWSP